eukprot:GAHX01002245.1.p1 GENE.GAHX01002245.1~~GAHX01002245.1.p1  ORF type:complete len:697 (-),score=137.45 GAHX01002245.1:36-2126(-)
MTTKKIQYFPNTQDGLSDIIKTTDNFKHSVLICNNNSFMISNYKSQILRRYSIKGFIRCLNNKALTVAEITYIVIDDPLYICNQNSDILYKVLLSSFSYLQEQGKTNIEIIIVKYNNSVEIGKEIPFCSSEITSTREVGKFFVEEKIIENCVNKKIVEFFQNKENSTFSKLAVVCPFKNSAVKNCRSLKNSLIKNFTQDIFEQQFDIVCLTDYNQNTNRLFVQKSNLTSNLIIFITLPVINNNVLTNPTFFKILSEESSIDCVFVKSTKTFNPPNFTVFTIKEWACINCLKYTNIHIFTPNKDVILGGQKELECSIEIPTHRVEANNLIVIMYNVMALVRSLDHPLIIKEHIKNIMNKVLEDEKHETEKCFRDMLQLNLLKERGVGLFICNNEAIFSVLLEKEEGLLYIKKIIEVFEDCNVKLSYTKAGSMINELLSHSIRQTTNRINKTMMKKINRVLPKTGFLMLFELNFNNQLMSQLKQAQSYLKNSVDKLFDKIKTIFILSLKILKFNGQIETIKYENDIHLKIDPNKKVFGSFLYYMLKFVASLNAKINLFSPGISRFIVNRQREQPLKIGNVYQTGPTLTVCIPICSLQSLRGYLFLSIKDEGDCFDKYYCFELSTCYRNNKTQIKIQIGNCTLGNNSKIKLIIADLKGSILLDAEEKLTQTKPIEIKTRETENKTEVIRNVLDFFHKYK